MNFFRLEKLSIFEYLDKKLTCLTFGIYSTVLYRVPGTVYFVFSAIILEISGSSSGVCVLVPPTSSSSPASRRPHLARLSGGEPLAHSLTDEDDPPCHRGGRIARLGLSAACARVEDEPPRNEQRGLLCLVRVPARHGGAAVGRGK